MSSDYRDLLAEFNAQGRIDVITEIDGVEFEDAWAERVSTRFEDQEVAVLSRKLLLRNKRATGRTQDLADAEWLEENEP